MHEDAGMARLAPNRTFATLHGSALDALTPALVNRARLQEVVFNPKTLQIMGTCRSSGN